jgi:hypothetical protein
VVRRGLGERTRRDTDRGGYPGAGVRASGAEVDPHVRHRLWGGTPPRQSKVRDFADERGDLATSPNPDLLF